MICIMKQLCEQKKVNAEAEALFFYYAAKTMRLSIISVMQTTYIAKKAEPKLIS